MRTSEPTRARASRLLALTLGAAVLTLTGCHSPAAPPTDPSTPGATPRAFTVMSTDEVTVTDPAAVTDQASSMFTLNAFQRLMTSAPGDDVLKPDAARDCLFTAATTYTCTMQKDLTFTNGDPLTSSDVKFSIERALRLDVAGSSTSLLSSLRRIETPDDLTVRFLLSREDTQFGWALASPAASLVDEQVYDADKVRSPKDVTVGSGPFVVAAFDDSGPSKSIVFTKFADYKGFSTARIATLTFRTVADSATIEDAMEKGEVDVVSRGLNAAAVTRLVQQVGGSPDRVTANGFSEHVLPGARVEQLQWSPSSPSRADKGLRTAIMVALQGDRTLDSVVPNGIVGHVPAFPQGGGAKPKVTWKKRINLTLAYDPTAPNAGDLADQVRLRLEDTGGLSVRLAPGAADADLVLVDRKAWTSTALSWLQPYVDDPLPASSLTVDATANAFRTSTDAPSSLRLLATLQRQAVTDAVLLPISQSDETVWVRSGADIADTSYGPGWQLGLFGVTA